MAIHCPHCKAQVSNDPRLAGQAVNCGHCGQQFTMLPLPTVRAIAPPVVQGGGQSVPVIDEGREASSNAASRIQEVPLWAWILLASIGIPSICCCGSTMLALIDAPRLERKYLEKQNRLAAELPDTANGHQWEAASAEAKAALVERVGPSWTSTSHREVIESVDTHFRYVQDGTTEGSLEDSVKEVIDRIVERKKQHDEERMRAYWTKRAQETDDPDMRQEYIRKALHDP